MIGFSRTNAASVGAALGVIVLAGPGAVAHAGGFQVSKLVSDGSVAAVTKDPNLINPWGMSASPAGPIWVSDNNSGFSTLYTGAGAKVPLDVAVPGNPTGQVFNGSASDFKVSGGGKTGAAAFLFAGEGGIISGWSPSVDFTNAQVAVDNSGSGAVYKGLAIGSSGGSNFLYAANFNSGQVEMYDSAFGLVKTFTDPNVAAGYAPFNVQNLGGTLYVTYALQNAAKHDDVAGAGHGYVDAFNLDGTFKSRLVSLGGAIDSPWGLDIAPGGFKSLAGDLLVGNFGDGTISAFNPTTGAFVDVLRDKNGAPIVEGDLWGLITGNGGSGGDANKVYFTAGVADEAHGLFGSIAAVPEPEAWALMLIGLGLMGATLRRRRVTPRVVVASAASDA
jgi:uncharacterized protein (TIGR03118 family)